MTEAFIITIAVMLGALGATHAAMTLRRSHGDSFRVMVRVRRGSVEGLSPRWRAARARWVRDVLILDARFAGPSVVVGIMGVASPRSPASGHRLRELGSSPMAVRLLADGGALIEVAAKHADAPLLTGPLVLGSGLAVLG